MAVSEGKSDSAVDAAAAVVGVVDTEESIVSVLVPVEVILAMVTGLVPVLSLPSLPFVRTGSC